MNITVTKTATPHPKPQDEKSLGFGRLFTDHMFLMDYHKGQGWQNPRVVPYGDFTLSPAAMVLHYGQAIFEGTKCYRRQDGELQLFRPQDNFARMSRSAQRMCMPPLDEEMALAGLKALLATDGDWVPHSPGTSLYIRPAMIALDPKLGVHAAHHYLFFIILSPVGAYYAAGLQPVKIYVEDQYVRAVRGGVGFTKCAGNYGASILAGEIASRQGFAQVLWLDGVEQKYIEEVGAMNICFVYGNRIVTPALNGSILPGITRDSVLQLAAAMGYQAEEKRLSMEEVFQDIKAGRITEAFGTGTAAVISPVGLLRWRDTDLTVGDGSIGPVAQAMYDQLTGIQYGTRPDSMGWVMSLSSR